MFVNISCLLTVLTVALSSQGANAAVDSSRTRLSKGANAKPKASETSTTTINGPANTSEFVQRSFTSHLTVNARTRDWGKLNIQRAPGSNFNTSFLASALTIAALPRLEVGTIPLFYGPDGLKDNFNLKWNFLRGEPWDLAVGFSQLDMTTSPDQPINGSTKFDLKTVAVQYIANYHPSFTRGSAAVTYTQAQSIIYSVDGPQQSSSRKNDEYAIDLSYPIQRKVDLTVGTGLLRGIGYTAFEDRKWGAGTTVAYYRPNSFFSKPFVGVHCIPKGDYWQIFIGSTIY